VYAYVGNSPVNFVDPLGLDAVLITSWETVSGVRIFGDHSALLVVNKGGPIPDNKYYHGGSILFDPSGGTYKGLFEGKENPQRPNTAYFLKSQFTMKSYIQTQQESGSELSMTLIRLTPEEEYAIIKKILEYEKNTDWAQCARTVSEVLREVDRFKHIDTGRPGVLFRDVERVVGE
jgi:hypothetical protein